MIKGTSLKSKTILVVLHHMIKHDSQGIQDYRTSPNNYWTLFQSAINFSSSYQYEYFACHKFPLHHFSLLTLPYDCFCLCFESKVRLNLTAKTLPRLWLNICSIVRVGEPSFKLQILHLQLVLYIPREDYCLSETPQRGERQDKK